MSEKDIFKIGEQVLWECPEESLTKIFNERFVGKNGLGPFVVTEILPTCMPVKKLYKIKDPVKQNLELENRVFSPIWLKKL